MLSPNQNKSLAVEGDLNLVGLQLLSRPTTAMPARCGDGEEHPGQVNSMPEERSAKYTPHPGTSAPAHGPVVGAVYAPTRGLPTRARPPPVDHRGALIAIQVAEKTVSSKWSPEGVLIVCEGNVRVIPPGAAISFQYFLKSCFV